MDINSHTPPIIVRPLPERGSAPVKNLGEAEEQFGAQARGRQSRNQAGDAVELKQGQNVGASRVGEPEAKKPLTSEHKTQANSAINEFTNVELYRPISASNVDHPASQALRELKADDSYQRQSYASRVYEQVAQLDTGSNLNAGLAPGSVASIINTYA